MNVKLRPRPSGEAACAVVREYPGADSPVDYVIDNGSNWALRTPSGLEGGHGIHDASADPDGNPWFTDNSPHPAVTLSRIDAKTGAIKTFKVADLNRLAAGAHGMTRA